MNGKTEITIVSHERLLEVFNEAFKKTLEELDQIPEGPDYQDLIEEKKHFVAKIKEAKRYFNGQKFKKASEKFFSNVNNYIIFKGIDKEITLAQNIDWQQVDKNSMFNM